MTTLTKKGRFSRPVGKRKDNKKDWGVHTYTKRQYIKEIEQVSITAVQMNRYYQSSADTYIL
jgi:hypothetical protein